MTSRSTCSHINYHANEFHGNTIWKFYINHRIQDWRSFCPVQKTLAMCSDCDQAFFFLNNLKISFEQIRTILTIQIICIIKLITIKALKTIVYYIISNNITFVGIQKFKIFNCNRFYRLFTLLATTITCKLYFYI